MRFFTCSPAERKLVEGVLAKSVPVGAMQAAVEDAAGRAVVWAKRAAGRLRAAPRSPATKTRFREAMSVFPEVVPAWRPANASWRDFGGLVAIRLTRAATILDGGWIRYFCWGDVAHCPECTGSPKGYFACSSFLGRYHICLGEHFWRAMRAGDKATMGSTLLHEALHIYFSRTVADTGRTGNANCYERFVIRSNGLSLHAATAANCPAHP